jgi:hypothetical protein
MRKVSLVAGALLAALAGCCGQEVSRDAVVGAWMLTATSREKLPPPLKSGSGRLVLSSDGRFTAVEVPGDLLYLRPASEVGLVTGNGTWDLVARDGLQRVKFVFEEISAGQQDNLPFGTELLVSHGAGAPGLFYYQGDPDAGQRITFEKR